MSDVAIRVENLGKEYRIGGPQGKFKYRTLREAMVDAAMAPVRRAGGLLRGQAAAASNLDQAFWALKDVSFEVKHGEAVGIIGRNGAGKSTLLKILSRITEPTTGFADVYGRVGSLLEVGTGFHPELTGRENIYLNGAILGMRRTEIDRRFDEIVDFAGVETFIDTPVKHYSSGMYVRLAFAVAAHLEPEILLVDEVLAVGDAAFQKKCLGKMGDVAREGRTILFVSHNMSAIAGLCQSATLLESGSVLLVGPVRDVINKYASTVATASTVDLTSLVHGGLHEYATLERLSVFDSDRNPCNTFPMGRELIVRVELRCTRAMTNVEVGVKINSLAGIAIHYFTSSWEGFHCDLPVGDHCFEVAVPQIMLLPGKYFLSAWILREGNWSDDQVQDITIIEVIGSNVNGHAPAFDKYAYSGCEVYAPSRWRLVEA